MTSYIEQFERIIQDMKAAMPKSDYLPWLEFLEQIHPESELLKTGESGAPQAREPTIEEDDPKPKECQDIRELMMLAECNGYPTWHIHPYVEDEISQEYETILFPTEKIQTISSSKLEELFRKYLSSLREQGITVDRILIKSDHQIMGVNGTVHQCLVFHPAIID